MSIQAAKELLRVERQIEKVQSILAELLKKRAELVYILRDLADDVAAH
mgnify:CR=1 FL=1